MKLWWVLVSGAFAILVVLNCSRVPNLLADSDTAVALQKITERGNPWSWFATDWPLENHFYRPISTLVFELDQALHPGSSAGFALTNALLVALTVLVLSWMTWEVMQLFGRVSIWGCAVPALFTISCLGWSPLWIAPLFVPAYFRFVELWHSRFKEPSWRAFWVSHGLAVAVSCALLAELNGIRPLTQHMIHWIPGRTASCMAVFFLAAVALLARGLRGLHQDRRPTGLHLTGTSGAGLLGQPSGADAPPPHPSSLFSQTLSPSGEGISATDGARALGPHLTGTLGAGPGKDSGANAPPKAARKVPILAAAVCAWLAMASYEQGVMLVPVLGILAWISFGFRRAVLPTLSGIVPLIAYAAIRLSVVPTGASRYQDQQFKSLSGGFYSIAEFVLPWLARISSALGLISSGWYVLLIRSPYDFLFMVFSQVALIVLTLHHPNRKVILFAYLASVVSFGPMAWFHEFGHYFFVPMAFRALMICAFLAPAFVLKNKR